MEDTRSFTLHGFWKGFRLCIPVAISVFAYGIIFGMLARQAGLRLTEALLMSGMVFAGASQFVALEMWTAPLPVATILMTTLVINLRHILMGAALRPWFEGLTRMQSYGSVFVLADENWALSMKEFKNGERDRAILAGSGLALFLAWLGATLVGQLLGSAFPNPETYGLDFAFTAVFVVLLLGMWKGKEDLLPWAVAAIVAVLGSLWLPGKWYILLGGLAGSITGAAGESKTVRNGN